MYGVDLSVEILGGGGEGRGLMFPELSGTRRRWNFTAYLPPSRNFCSEKTKYRSSPGAEKEK